VPLLPLLGALLNGVVLWNRISKKMVAVIACGVVGLSCLIGIGAIASYMGSAEYAAHEPFEQILYLWVPAGELTLNDGSLGNLQIELGYLLDPLSAVMLFTVSFVGFWIHIYSFGYMSHDDGFQRYFVYLNLFMGAMLLLVLGSNFLVLFVGWEGVGLCSYLLIGFWYREDFPPYAGRKAFIVNRIGDAGFLMGLFALASTYGTLNYRQIFGAILEDPSSAAVTTGLGLSVATFVAISLLIGATGKSAQIPLYVWLPDAMAGPTPVSALIHAATMVTAGVYMVARANVIYQLASGVADAVAVIGAITAIFAATIGLAQTDIKKVLAYSTVSQLGYMFLAAGVGAYGVAVFHLFTHAFFKGLLFLGSGSVIHGMGGEQDMRRMGGLRKAMPTTYWTFLIGTLAIAGVPGFAGFFSKDQILAASFDGYPLLWTVGLITAGLTACYMFRLLYLTFFGEFRGTEEQWEHLHESPPVITVPLVVLAIGAVVSGWIGLPRLGHWDWNWFGHFLAPVFEAVGGHGEEHHLSLALELGLMAASVAVAALGIFMAWKTYGGDRGLEGGQRWADRFPAIHRMLVNKYWVDEVYDATIVRGTWATARSLFRFDAGFIDGFLVMGTRNLTVLSAYLSGFFDKYFVDGLVNLVAWVLQAGSKFFRRLQTGLVSQYALVMAVGMFVLLFFYVVVSMRG
ncbi:MAG: NADH-quinone oxidoreductase subunit L, partial [Acidobacteriota bacterium]